MNDSSDLGRVPLAPTAPRHIAAHGACDEVVVSGQHWQKPRDAVVVRVEVTTDRDALAPLGDARARVIEHGAELLHARGATGERVEMRHVARHLSSE